MSGFFILLAIIGVIAFFIIGVYNGLIKLKNRTQEAWSDIDVQLKRRADLIPNLVNTVKGGIELSSGGERINDRETLIRRLREKGLKPEDYTWYLDMFRYGVPPHGGFGLGIERLLQAMLRLDNIMEAVLLPRTPQRLRP